MFILGMDLTILNVAIPDLHADLRPSMAQIQWIVDGYALILGGTVLACGALTDRMGRRRTFLAGLVLCAGTSVLGAVAQTPLQTIAARGGMGAAGALMMPATLSIIHWMYPEPMLRRRAIAVWTAVAAAGGLTGPVIGGWLVEHFSWRAGFWVNVPLAATAFLLTCLLVPESRAKRTEPLDGVGTAMSAAGLLVLVWAIIESPVRGWTSGPVLLAYASGALLLALFAVRQARTAFPMLPPALMRDPRVSMAAVALALMSFALFGALFVITLHLQGVLGYTPWQAGVRTLPLPLALAVGAIAALPLGGRWGQRLPIVTGLLLITAAFAILATTTAADGYAHLMLFQAVAGLGAGATAAAGTESVMSAVPGDRAGLGSAVNDATRQVGSSLGVAVQGSLLSSVYHHRMADSPPGAGDNILAVRGTASHLPKPQALQLIATAKESFISGLTATAALAGVVTFATALAAARWLPGSRRPAALDPDVQSPLTNTSPSTPLRRAGSSGA
ncbi:MFS transporter [Streptomyces sp. Je 1-332]|uniref:MFS transporter n=1 Tax=Streptomyces sp. Je 1-332 TaxID=3231270 RepID=UPI0034583E5B